MYANSRLNAFTNIRGVESASVYELASVTVCVSHRVAAISVTKHSDRALAIWRRMTV